MLSRRIFQKLTDSLLLRSSEPLYLCKDICCRQCQIRSASSSTRWKSRQTKDHFTREAKVQGLKSRAAFKLFEINEKYRLFKPSMTVVDLGYAPGSWSQVAVNLTRPNGRVVGIDILPAQPPKGVSTIQGDFLSPHVQEQVRAYVREPSRGRPRKKAVYASREEAEAAGLVEDAANGELDTAERGYIELERHADLEFAKAQPTELSEEEQQHLSRKERDDKAGRIVDVVLSDMLEPWPQTSGFYKRSVSNPYLRMMNTSGMAFRDHAGSMDLCMAALTFCFDTLRTGGHFVCKFYQGAEDKALELRMKKLFERVNREKPESSRNESKEAYLVALKRKESVAREDVFPA